MSYFFHDLSTTEISVEGDSVRISTYSDDFTQILGERIMKIDDLCELDKSFLEIQSNT